MPGLKDSINIGLWQKTQDNFAKEEQNPIATIDLEGKEVSVSNKFPFFCQMIKNKNPGLCDKCREESLRSLKSADGKDAGPTLFKCHAGLNYVLVPFSLNSSMMGGILCEGFITDQKEDDLREMCAEISRKTGIGADELFDEVKKLQRFSNNQVEMSRYLVKMVSNTLPDLCYQDYRSKKELSEMKVVQKITSMLNSTLDLDNILQSMVSFLVERLNLENCSIILMENKRRYVFNEAKKEVLKQVEAVILKQLSNTGNPSYALSLRKDFMMKDIPGIEKAEYSVSAFPIVAQKKMVGIINLYNKENFEMDNDLIQLVKVVIDQAGVALMNASHYRQTAESAVTDKLTELYNRRYFNENFKEEIESGKKDKRPISLIMFDIDDFKIINDTSGHVEGDRILKEIGEITKKSLRSHDTACRYGGEEFVVILPNTKLEDAQAVAERLRQSIESEVRKPKDYEKNVTISLGIITCLNSSVNDSVMLREADNSLYKAKSRGKNRIASSLIIDKNLSVVDVDKAHDAYVR